MLFDKKAWIGCDLDTNERISILPKMANRHGLIAGATGTGKTVTLKVMAESFSDMGVPVFLSDVKGDLAGMLQMGEDNEGIRKRIQSMDLETAGFRYQKYPVQFWDLSAEKGMPLRTTISEFGPALLARLLELTDLQADILTIVFRIADENNLLLLDTKDLRSMLQYVSQNAKEFSMEYGNMAPQSLNAILRAVVALETAGGDQFFGEPALDIHDFFNISADGKGMINILDAEKTISNTKIYATFMLYLMAELFEQLPEAGDPEKPKMVFFFDEAHLLFDGAPKVFLEKIEQVVKLIRSKGVGIYFITQNPADIPDGVLSQLGNKVQHALRAYTPTELKKLKAAAQSFRINPAFNTEEALQEIGTGEALISFLDETGCPMVVRRCQILPPQSRMGSIDETARRTAIQTGELRGKYDTLIDRDSAYEFLKRTKDEETARLAKEAEEREQEKQAEKEARLAEKEAERAAKEEARLAEKEARLAEKEAEAKAKQAERERKQKLSTVKSVGRTTAGTLGREVGSSVGKSLLGSTFGKRIGGNIGAALGRGLLDTFFGK